MCVPIAGPASTMQAGDRFMRPTFQPESARRGSSASSAVRDAPVATKVSLLALIGLLATLVVGLVGQSSTSKTNHTASSLVSDVSVRAVDFGVTREAFARMRINLVQAGTSVRPAH